MWYPVQILIYEKSQIFDYWGSCLISLILILILKVLSIVLEDCLFIHKTLILKSLKVICFF